MASDCFVMYPCWGKLLEFASTFEPQFVTMLCCFTTAFQLARGKPGPPSSSCQEPLSNRGSASWVKAQFCLVRISCLPLGPRAQKGLSCLKLCGLRQHKYSLGVDRRQVKQKLLPHQRCGICALPSGHPPGPTYDPSLTPFLIPVPLSSLSLPLLCGFITGF